MIWEHFPDLSWILWYCTEQEVGRSAPGKFGRYKTCLQLGEVVSKASLLGYLLSFTICCSFCLWKDVPKIAVHEEGPVWLLCRRGGMGRRKAKRCRVQTLHALPRPFWHLYMITKKHGRAVEKTDGTLVSFSSKCPRYLSCALQLVLDVERWEFLWKMAKLLVPLPSVFIIFKHLPLFCSILLSHSPHQVHHLRLSHHPSSGHYSTSSPRSPSSLRRLTKTICYVCLQ